MNMNENHSFLFITKGLQIKIHIYTIYYKVTTRLHTHLFISEHSEDVEVSVRSKTQTSLLCTRYYACYECSYVVVVVVGVR